MEFNEQFYHRLFKLTASRKESSLVEIRKIVQDVKAHYIANGITELWQNLPGEEMVRQDSNLPDAGAVIRRFDKEKPMAPLKRDSLVGDVSGGHLLKPSPARLSASPHVHPSIVEKKNSSEVLDAGDTSLDSEPIRFMQNIKLDQESEISASIRNDDDNISSVSTKISGIKRSISNEETSSSMNLNEPPPPKQRKIDNQTRISTEKLTGKAETASSFGQNLVEESFGGLFCVVCKQFSNPSGNRMLECHECHNLYHQKCHEPNIPQSQIDDPRLLWYCNGCSKKLKKSTVTVSKPSSQPSGAKLQSKELNKDKPKSLTDQTLKRNDSKEKVQLSNQSSFQQKYADFLAKHNNKAATQVKPSSTTTPLPSSLTPTTLFGTTSSSSNASGLAGLTKLATSQQKLPTTNVSGLGKLQQIAASTANSTLKSSSTSTSASSSVPKTPNFSSGPMMQAAEKRLQQMKKKAMSKSSFMK